MSRLLASGPEHFRGRIEFVERDRFIADGDLVRVFVAQLEELHAAPANVLEFFFGLGHRGDKDLLVLVLDPATANLVEAVSLLRFTTVDHVIVEQVVVAAALPDLRVHDDGRIETDHLESPWGTRRPRPVRCGR